MDKGTNLYPCADIEESDSLGPVQLVSAGTEHVNVIFIHLDGHMGKCLYRIGVEQNPVFPGNGPDFLDRLNGANLIIGKHH